eukprot:CAMPEP_0203753794 /NCGR_PEP_ID=MMETSP0098-20131031/7501_1 /ASSEMBLY_ACC=CAM_ASM_000208 /TAXON_ID=96639 /ORGANISM=" , Strain NY0313808BC1" /LENGTH=645 /DNA_ID=CAMNT_0050644543 /DNA_START=53 /DNA_END=1990 /DNA_ORIENTATION=+
MKFLSGVFVAATLASSVNSEDFNLPAGTPTRPSYERIHWGDKIHCNTGCSVKIPLPPTPTDVTGKIFQAMMNVGSIFGTAYPTVDYIQKSIVTVLGLIEPEAENKPDPIEEFRKEMKAYVALIQKETLADAGKPTLALFVESARNNLREYINHRDRGQLDAAREDCDKFHLSLNGQYFRNGTVPSGQFELDSRLDSAIQYAVVCNTVYTASRAAGYKQVARKMVIWQGSLQVLRDSFETIRNIINTVAWSRMEQIPTEPTRSIIGDSAKCGRTFWKGRYVHSATDKRDGSSIFHWVTGTCKNVVWERRYMSNSAYTMKGSLGRCPGIEQKARACLSNLRSSIETRLLDQFSPLLREKDTLFEMYKKLQKEAEAFDVNSIKLEFDEAEEVSAQGVTVKFKTLEGDHAVKMTRSSEHKNQLVGFYTKAEADVVAEISFQSATAFPSKFRVNMGNHVSMQFLGTIGRYGGKIHPTYEMMGEGVLDLNPGAVNSGTQIKAFTPSAAKGLKTSKEGLMELLWPKISKLKPQQVQFIPRATDSFGRLQFFIQVSPLVVTSPSELFYWSVMNDRTHKHDSKVVFHKGASPFSFKRGTGEHAKAYSIKNYGFPIIPELVNGSMYMKKFYGGNTPANLFFTFKSVTATYLTPNE